MEIDNSVIFINHIVNSEIVSSEFVANINNSDNDSFTDRIKQESSSVDVSEKSNSECSICLEIFESEGKKRCVVTPCGHIFCFECISIVILTSKNCPKCRKKVKLNNLITLYDTVVHVVDKSLVEKVERQLTEEKTKRTILDAALAKARQREYELISKLSMSEKKNEELKSMISFMRTSHESSITQNGLKRGFLSTHSSQSESAAQSESSKIQFIHRESSHGLIVTFVSCSSPDDTLLCGWRLAGEGAARCCIRKFRLSDLTATACCFGEFANDVREIACSPFPPNSDLICAVSNDVTAQLLSFRSLRLLCTLLLGQLRGFCCCFSSSQQNQLFVGCARGVVLMFDLTGCPVTATPIRQFSADTGSSNIFSLPPIQSVCHVSAWSESDPPTELLLATHHGQAYAVVPHTEQPLQLVPISPPLPLYALRPDPRAPDSALLGAFAGSETRAAAVGLFSLSRCSLSPCGWQLMTKTLLEGHRSQMGRPSPCAAQSGGRCCLVMPDETLHSAALWELPVSSAEPVPVLLRLPAHPAPPLCAALAASSTGGWVVATVSGAELSLFRLSPPAPSAQSSPPRKRPS